MIFRRTEPNANYRALRCLSDSGRWELGLSPYRHGIRLRMGLSGRPPSVIDFCLGHDASLCTPALLAVTKCLEAVPESASPGEIDALFPWAGTRPEPAVHLVALLASGSRCGSSSGRSVTGPINPASATGHFEASKGL